MAQVTEQAKLYIVIAIVVVIILIAVYYEGYASKPTSTVTVTNDEGGVTSATPADQQKAQAVAAELYNAMYTVVLGFAIGTSLFAGSTAFDDLAALSNVQFALCFSAYNNTYGKSLLADLQNNWQIFGTGAANVAIQRAQQLGITT